MLQATTNINVDFCDKKYILINAKQLDKKTRFLSVTCYNNGEPYSINNGEHSAYIRYKKSDNNSVFNFCEIDRKGKIIVELTEQMLVADGLCCADLVLVNKGAAEIDTSTGEIVGINNTGILSTMTFYIDVAETVIANSEIESSYEYDGLNDLLERAEAHYQEVVLTAKSYAVGDAGGIRENENIDNAKYYYQQAAKKANEAEISAENASQSEENVESYIDNALAYSQNAETYMNNAETYMNNTKTYMNNANVSAENAKVSETSAKASETNASISETNAKTSEINAKASEINAKNSETSASNSEANAKDSENNALIYANKSQSYAVGGTGTRGDEDTNNAHYYYELIKNIVIGLDTGFIPMGTVAFAELATVEKATGYVYNISDDFITDETFREGAGKSYTAGTNVYYCASNEWDCFGGAASPTATVNEVKDYLGI